jgi:hypothetical protein
MFAISSHPHLSIMRFKDRLEIRNICILFDSGSTHNFVNLNILLLQEEFFIYVQIQKEYMVYIL